MNKLLGIDIDEIIKKVLVETLGSEKAAQKQKSSEMKDFKAPSDSKKDTNSDVDEDEEDGPVEKDTQEKKGVKAAEIVELLNQMRSGKSLKDADTRKNFQEYFNGLGGAERLALHAFITALADIISGAEGPEAKPGDEASPEDYGIEMDVEQKKDDSSNEKKSKKKSSKKDDSAPIVVGESANKTREFRILRGLK